ncbi:uncharacterized protein BROUX77_001542 [Berkeleyomyces rouxiae]|uniref:uncharacterized protein n=1 Tax=Berkeleyomyces rouxiae TaxID=2035830 RepID=UPI003B775BAA
MASRVDEQRPLLRRESSTPHYQTLPVTPPPASTSLTTRSSFSSFHTPRLSRLLSFRNRLTSPSSQPSPPGYTVPKPAQESERYESLQFHSAFGSHASPSHASPLPYNQLGILALVSMSEQSALNSISPYLPAMVASFHDVPSDQVSLYIGLLASSFALAQLCSNFLWGSLSDRIGRKPVLMMGTFFLLCSCVGFGFSTSFHQAVLMQVAMGALNGNAAVFPTAVGELTDRSNQSTAFTWLPIVYSVGSITGPAMGGLFAGRYSERYPYAPPNLFSAGLLAVTFLVMGMGFTEPNQASRQHQKTFLECLPRLLQRLVKPYILFLSPATMPLRPSSSTTVSVTPSNAQDEHQDEDEGDQADDAVRTKSQASFLNRTTVLLLGSYFIFQLCSVAFATLFPVFAASPAPAGRSLDPATIGLLMTVSGLATMVFQAFIFPSLKTEHGNIGMYRFSILGLSLCLALMPLVGYLDSNKKQSTQADFTVYGEIFLLNNSCPDSQHLGALNGLAQSLSAAGRSLGPFVAGTIFYFALSIGHQGTIVSWGLFAAVAVGGWLGSLGIHCLELESDDYRELHDESLV